MYDSISIFLSEIGRVGVAIDNRNFSRLLYVVQPANHRTSTGKPSPKKKVEEEEHKKSIYFGKDYYTSTSTNRWIKKGTY